MARRNYQIQRTVLIRKTIIALSNSEKLKIFGNSGSRATAHTARAFERKIILSKVAVVSWCRHTVASIHCPPHAPCRALCRPKPRTYARTLSAAAAALVWRNTRHSVSGLWRAGPTVFASSDARSSLPLTFITTVPPPPPPSPPSDGTSVLRGRRHYAPRPTTLRWRRRRVSIAISESSLVERARAAAVVVISMPRLNAVAAHGQRRPPFSVPRLCTGRRRSVRAI